MNTTKSSDILRNIFASVLLGFILGLFVYFQFINPQMYAVLFGAALIPFPKNFKVWDSIEVEFGFKAFYRKNNKPVIVFISGADNSGTITTIEKIDYYLKLWNVTLNRDIMKVYEEDKLIGVALRINRTNNYIIVVGKFTTAHKIALDIRDLQSIYR
jgi:hypothetical protein